MPFVTTKMELEGGQLSKTSQKEKDDLTDMWDIKKKKKKSKKQTRLSKTNPRTAELKFPKREKEKGL